MKPYSRAYLEITSVCNLKCSFCPSPTLERARQFMSPAQFATLAPQVAELAEQVCLHVLGEPLLHPQFEQILEICHQNHLAVQLTTNGTLIAKKGEQLLHAPALRQLNFSLHALPEGPLLKTPSEHLDEILAYCETMLRLRPEVYLNLRLWNSQGMEQEQAAEWNAYVAQSVQQILGVEWDLEDVVHARKSKRLLGRLYVQTDTQFTWPSQTLQGDARKQGYCHALKTHFAVLVDGRVVPCCLDEKAAMELGNAFEAPLAQILSNTRASQMRDGFARGELVEPTCQDCTFCRRFTVKTDQRVSAKF